jgi:hypothetical protein
MFKSALRNALHSTCLSVADTSPVRNAPRYVAEHIMVLEAQAAMELKVEAPCRSKSQRIVHMRSNCRPV